MYFATFSHIAQKESCSVGERLQEFAAEARMADELGLDYIFTTEHHFTGRFSLSPSQPVTLTVLAQVTRRIRFGPMVIILPIVQPLRVLEELTILDHMSGGRLELGFGRGITPHEHVTYGVEPHQDKERFQEGLDFLMKAMNWPGRFSWLGKHFTYIDVDMPWQFLQKPHPPIWCPTNTPDTAYEYGKLGWGCGGFGVLGAGLYDRVFAEYQRGWEEAGHPPERQRLAYLASTVIADTDDEARELMHDNFARQMDLFILERELSRDAVGGNLARVAEASLQRLKTIMSDLGRAEQEMRFMCGSPETVTAKIATLQERLGFNVYMGEFSFGELPFEAVKRSYELLAAKVVPALGRTQ
jgi:alkanesulfonate monooxygenase SsuD/methylene tetrahydromethanopterin reductase-like flavin-dependent oxidoreductase (luciferase family)